LLEGEQAAQRQVLRNLMDQIDKLETERDALRQNLVALQQKNDELLGKNKSLAGKEQNLEQHNKSLAEKAQNLEQHNKSLAEKAQNLEQQLEALQKTGPGANSGAGFSAVSGAAAKSHEQADLGALSDEMQMRMRQLETSFLVVNGALETSFMQLGQPAPGTNVAALDTASASSAQPLTAVDLETPLHNFMAAQQELFLLYGTRTKKLLTTLSLLCDEMEPYWASGVQKLQTVFRNLDLVAVALTQHKKVSLYSTNPTLAGHRAALAARVHSSWEIINDVRMALIKCTVFKTPMPEPYVPVAVKSGSGANRDPSNGEAGAKRSRTEPRK
jgi:myosin heavy subunit